MTNGFRVLVILSAASILTGGCAFDHSTSVLAPTSVDGSSGSTTGGGSGNAVTPSMVGTWASSNALPALPSPSTCGNFQYQITSQTASTIAGAFTATCGGGLAVSGQASGQLNGTAVSFTASGTASGPGIPNCAFTLAGNGAIEDNGNTLRVP